MWTGKENRIRPWGSAKAHKGNEVQRSVEPPLGGQGKHFQSALDGCFNSPLPAEGAFFLGLAVERPVTPSHCLLPIFSAWWGRKEEKEAEKAKKETVTAPIPWLSIIDGGGKAVSLGRIQEGWRKVPGCFFEKLKSFHFYSNIINKMEKSHFTSFLLNNLAPECSFVCCVPLPGPASLRPLSASPSLCA